MTSGGSTSSPEDNQIVNFERQGMKICKN
jgi:hypothetical protein